MDEVLGMTEVGTVPYELRYLGEGSFESSLSPTTSYLLNTPITSQGMSVQGLKLER